MKKTSKAEFITYISGLYGKYLTDAEKKTWLKDCNDIIPNNTDFDQLRFYFLREFDTKTINIPSPQWFYKASLKFIPNQKTKEDIERENLNKLPQSFEIPSFVGERWRKHYESLKNDAEELAKKMSADL